MTPHFSKPLTQLKALAARGSFFILGAARSGQGCLAAAQAHFPRTPVVLYDQNSDLLANPQLKAFAQQGGALYLGPPNEGYLDGVSLLITSPGISGSHPLIVGALRRGIPVLSELEFASRLLNSTIVAITGTNGKTTTTALIGHLLSCAGVQAELGGNIGYALTHIAARPTHPDFVVTEVSSFQLEAAPTFSPRIAVLLNITPDHLDRHGSFAKYRRIKLSLFSHQSEEDVAILPLKIAREHAPRRPRLLTFAVQEGTSKDANLYYHEGSLWETLTEKTPTAIISWSEIALRGNHNIENVLAACGAALNCGINRDDLALGLRSFKGVAHRLEEVGEKEGVLWVNDSKGTNEEATLSALRAFNDRKVHLILGGSVKGSDFKNLAREVALQKVSILLIGEAAPVIAKALSKEGVAYQHMHTLEKAAAQARLQAKPDDVILLSPACASFDQYKNYEERGEHFKTLARSHMRIH